MSFTLKCTNLLRPPLNLFRYENKKIKLSSFVAPAPATDDSTDVYPPEEEESLEDLCDPACYTHTSCENCTSTGCMWCSNEQRCVESNSYVASFPYGQCMEWTTQKAKCPGNCIRHIIHVSIAHR